MVQNVQGWALRLPFSTFLNIWIWIWIWERDSHATSASRQHLTGTVITLPFVLIESSYLDILDHKFSSSLLRAYGPNRDVKFRQFARDYTMKRDATKDPLRGREAFNCEGCCRTSFRGAFSNCRWKVVIILQYSTNLRYRQTLEILISKITLLLFTLVNHGEIAM